MQNQFRFLVYTYNTAILTNINEEKITWDLRQ